LQRANHRLCRLAIAIVDDGRAHGCETAGNGSADPTSGAGHDRHTVGERNLTEVAVHRTELLHGRTYELASKRWISRVVHPPGYILGYIGALRTRRK
jgi:hypothetical protein